MRKPPPRGFKVRHSRKPENFWIQLSHFFPSSTFHKKLRSPQKIVKRFIVLFAPARGFRGERDKSY
jgi:hypothetical protein